MSDLIELAERVERGAEVKWLTADIDDLTRALIGPSWTLYDWGFADDAIRKNSLDATVALLERVLPGWRWQAGTDQDDGGPNAAVWRRSESPVFQSYAPAPARALLAAILSALADKGSGRSLADATPNSNPPE